MEPITISRRTLHIMHNHHMHKSETSYVNSFIGAICTWACLDRGYAPLNLVIETSCSTFSSIGMSPLTMGPTCNVDAHVLIKWTLNKHKRKLAQDKGSCSVNYF
jgi:hypothetical protein